MDLWFSHSVLSNSFWPHGLQHSRLPCPSPSPGACSNSCPLSPWCHPTISSSVTPFSSCPQSFPASGSFPMSWLLASGGKSTGASTSASVLPVNNQGWFPLWLTGLISLRSSGLIKDWNPKASNSLFLPHHPVITGFLMKLTCFSLYSSVPLPIPPPTLVSPLVFWKESLSSGYHGYRLFPGFTSWPFLSPPLCHLYPLTEILISEQACFLLPKLSKHFLDIWYDSYDQPCSQLLWLQTFLSLTIIISEWQWLHRLFFFFLGCC